MRILKTESNHCRFALLKQHKLPEKLL